MKRSIAFFYLSIVATPLSAIAQNPPTPFNLSYTELFRSESLDKAPEPAPDFLPAPTFSNPSADSYRIEGVGLSVFNFKRLGARNGELYSTWYGKAPMYSDWDIFCRVTIPSNLPLNSEVGLIARAAFLDKGYPERKREQSLGFSVTVVKTTATVRKLYVKARSSFNGVIVPQAITFPLPPASDPLTLWMRLVRRGPYFQAYVKNNENDSWGNDLAANWSVPVKARTNEWLPRVELDAMPLSGFTFKTNTIGNHPDIGGNLKRLINYREMIGGSAYPGQPKYIPKQLHVGFAVTSGNATKLDAVNAPLFDRVSMTPASFAQEEGLDSGLQGRFDKVAPNLALLAGTREDFRSSTVDLSAMFSAENLKRYKELFPQTTLSNNAFLARWAGVLHPRENGEYELALLTTGGVRMWIANALDATRVPENWQPVIDHWKGQPHRPIDGHPTAEVRGRKWVLEAGKEYPIRVQFLKSPSNKQPPVCSLRWRRPGTTEPELVGPNFLTVDPAIRFEEFEFKLKPTGVTDTSIGISFDTSLVQDPTVNSATVKLDGVPVTTTANMGFTFASLQRGGRFMLEVEDALSHWDSITVETDREPHLPTEWSLRPVGRVGVQGAASYRNGKLVLAAAGQGLRRDKPDGFHFLYRAAPDWSSGSVIGPIELDSLASPNHPTAASGLMLRTEVAPTKPFIYLGFQPRSGINFIARYLVSTGQPPKDKVVFIDKTFGNARPPRAGDRLQFQITPVLGSSKDEYIVTPQWQIQGEAWINETPITVEFFASRFKLAGLAGFSGSSSEAVTAVFNDDVSQLGVSQGLIRTYPRIQVVEPFSGQMFAPATPISLQAQIDGLPWTAATSRYGKLFRIFRKQPSGLFTLVSELPAGPYSPPAVGTYRIVVRALSGSEPAPESLPVTIIVAESDTDTDSLDDAFETRYFPNVSLYGPADDADGDGISNVKEFEAGTNPTEFNLSSITDDNRSNNTGTRGNGIFDAWEIAHFGALLKLAGDNGYNPDSDGDGLFDSEEFLLGTNPNFTSVVPAGISDSDGDGIRDGSDPDPLIPNGLKEEVWVDDKVPAVDVRIRDLGLVSPAFVTTIVPTDIQDQIFLFDNAATSLNMPLNPNAAFFFFNGAFRNVGAPLTEDRGDDLIPCGTGYVIRKAGTPGGTSQFWTNVTLRQVGESWIWRAQHPLPVSGESYHVSKSAANSTEVHEHGFSFSTLPTEPRWNIAGEDRFVFYFYPNPQPNAAPQALVVEYTLRLSGQAEDTRHYIYLGPGSPSTVAALGDLKHPTNNPPLDESNDRMWRASGIPQAGMWNRIAVNASDLGVPSGSSATLVGIIFRCRGGGGAWDRIGKVVPDSILPPSLSPNGGSFSDPISVTLASPVAGRKIHYSLTVPSQTPSVTLASPWVVSGAAVQIPTDRKLGAAVEFEGRLSLMVVGGFTIGDHDGDGQADAYERARGLNPSANDATGNPDGDGLVNSQDVRPFDPQLNALQITIIHPAPNSTLP